MATALTEDHLPLVLFVGVVSYKKSRLLMQIL